MKPKPPSDAQRMHALMIGQPGFAHAPAPAAAPKAPKPARKAKAAAPEPQAPARAAKALVDRLKGQGG